MTASSSGGASWYTQCLHAPDGETVTITVTGGGKSGSGSYKTDAARRDMALNSTKESEES